MFDDGEKFGLWPDTHKYVYGDGWLETLLDRSRKQQGLDRDVTNFRLFGCARSAWTRVSAHRLLF